MEEANLNEMINRGISCLESGENEEAIKIFYRVIQADSGFKSLDEITDVIKSLASLKQPTCLRLPAQKALIGLGVAYIRKGMITIAEDCILNGAYKSQDEGVLFLAGTFYLVIRDAELDTAFAYFKEACQVDPRWLYKCDGMVQWFLRRRGSFYPNSIIRLYIGLWDKIKKEITEQLTDTTPVEDSFVDHLLGFLVEFGEKETGWSR
ncbi:MAG: hypothetical protein RMK18_09805 [Armatimonadota bacterium]|nr:hypothetical protein [Armatimonadota bacterium]MCX7777972.1 hypothetical protein [Armatimonadota bacterium]MDW8026137.1 hypothetical protein [Armatimonadota bacterium]